MSKQQIIILCILSNLLIGNAIIYLGKPSYASVNYPLMLTMSLVCIICYLFVFKYINFKSWNIFKLLAFSIFVCAVIELIGSIFTIVFTGLNIERSDYVYNTLFGIFVGAIIGIIGNIVMLPVTIAMGVLNLFWFRKYQIISSER